MKKLGNLIYKLDLGPFVVSYPNDANGHMNNSDYFNFCEKIRKAFLERFEWSDEFFNASEIAFNVRSYGESLYKLPLKNGDEFKVDLEVSEGRSPFFHLCFRFYNKKGELVFETQSNNIFVNTKNNPNRPESIPVPEFFYNALKKSR